jgi:BMFP domain-containing protein YqiC
VLATKYKEKPLKVYVKNNGQYTLTFAAVEEIAVEDVSGRKSRVNRELFTREFGVKRNDPVTGLIKHTGYTEINKDDYEIMFKSNKKFQNAIVNGALTKFDAPPDEALLDSQLLVRTQEENEKLKAEVQRLEDIIRGGGKQAKAEKKSVKEPEL